MLMHDMGEGEVGSHNVGIILQEGLLNDDVWLQRGEGGQRSGETWLCNNKWTLPYIKRNFH